MKGFQPKAFSRNIPQDGFDPIVQAYINAVLSTGQSMPVADQEAFNTFYLAIVAGGYASKFRYLRPNYGTSAASCKWNALNPLDTDAAYRATYHGGITFPGNGVKGNGINGYVDNKLNPTTAGMVANSKALHSYIIGASPEGYALSAQENIFGGDQFTPNFPALGTAVRSISDSNQGFVIQTQGMYTVERAADYNSGEGERVFKNGVLQSSTPRATGANPNRSYFSLCRNIAGVANGPFGNFTIGLEGVSDGMTSSEVVDFHSNVNALMTAWGRNVY